VKETVEFIRPPGQHLSQSIVVTDGLSSSGKSIVTPLLSTLERGELWLMDSIFEYLCVADSLGSMKRDAAATMVNLCADNHLYNLMISRNTNFRKTDLTSASRNLLEERHQQRLTLNDGNTVVEQIRKVEPIQTLMTHYILGVSDLLYEAFGGRLKLMVVTVRHPLWLLENWLTGCFTQRIGSDPREFHLCVEAEGQAVPWFTAGWERDYLSMNDAARSIRTVASLSERQNLKIAGMSARQKSTLLVIPFERYVTNPRPFLDRITSALGTRTTESTDRMMRDLGIPRDFSRKDIAAQGEKIASLLAERDADKASLQLLNRLCEEYEAEYMA